MIKNGKAYLAFGFLAISLIFTIACIGTYSEDTLTAKPEEIQAAFSKLDKAKFHSTLQNSDIGIVTKKEWETSDGSYRNVRLTVALENSGTITLVPDTGTLKDATETWIVASLQVGDLIAFRDVESVYNALNPRNTNTLAIQIGTVRVLINHEDLGLVVRENRHWK